jgi:transcriptional regulator with XRE-family HTH domain
MTEFAQLIGSDQSTISRYESGHVVPSRTTLILLLLLSAEDERKPILEALGDVDEKLVRSRFADAREILTARSPSKSVRRRSGADQTRALFAEESAAIVSSAKQIEPALVEILKLCREHSENRNLSRCLSQMVPYFRFVVDQPRGTIK